MGVVMHIFKVYDQIYYSQKYYQFVLRQKIKYFNLELQRHKELLLSYMITIVRFETTRPLFVFKNPFIQVSNYDMNKNKDISFRE